MQMLVLEFEFRLISLQKLRTQYCRCRASIDFHKSKSFDGESFCESLRALKLIVDGMSHQLHSSVSVIKSANCNIHPSIHPSKSKVVLNE